MAEKRASSPTRGGTSLRPARATAAPTEPTSGTAKAAWRQLSSPSAPDIGMPTIHAAGWPISAHERTCLRRASGAHSAAAAVPALTRSATPTPTTACERTSSSRRCATALAIAPPATSPVPRNSSAFSRTRPRRRASQRAVIPAASPDAVRTWPAAAVETWKSAATPARTGAIEIRPAWAVKSAAKRATLTRR